MLLLAAIFYQPLSGNQMYKGLICLLINCLLFNTILWTFMSNQVCCALCFWLLVHALNNILQWWLSDISDRQTINTMLSIMSPEPSTPYLIPNYRVVSQQ